MADDLTGARRGLVRLHKALMDAERIAWEREHGRLSAGELLQAVINDPFFAWLRPLSELIVRIDELADGDAPPGDEEVRALQATARTLLKPQDPGFGLAPPSFGTRYHAALQGDPAVVLAHAAALRALAGDG